MLCVPLSLTLTPTTKSQLFFLLSHQAKHEGAEWSTGRSDPTAQTNSRPDRRLYALRFSRPCAVCICLPATVSIDSLHLVETRTR